jgi:hypothetical protein
MTKVVDSGGKRTLFEDTKRTLTLLNRKMRVLCDVLRVPDGSPVDTKIQGALDQLFEALYDLPQAVDPDLLDSRGPLVYPIPGRDMRFWWTSDRVRASTLLKGERATRIYAAVRVTPPEGEESTRALTVRQYLELFDRSIVTERNAFPRGYENYRVLV